MAFDPVAEAQKYLPSSDGAFNPTAELAKYGIKPKADLTTSQGLLDTANSAGGAVAKKANQITGGQTSLLTKIGTTLKTGLIKTLDILQRPNFAIATAVKNTIDKDPNTSFGGGLVSGITGQTKNTFSDVFSEAGINPTSKVGKFTKGAAGFALDVLLDPTTYITFGESAGVKVTTELGEKTLTKEGANLLSKGLAQKAGQEFGTDFVKKAIVKMSETSPELYKKFIDQGGVKFFGQTIMSGGRVAALAKAIPGISKLDEVTQPVRNTLYALFNRDASATFGKLPKEFSDLKQTYLDLGKVKSEQAINEVVKIAEANKLTSQEAEIISNAIETKLPLADNRLENARKLIEQKLGRNLKDEQKAGITVGELPNYVPHILLDEPVKNIPFSPQGISSKLNASKSRNITGTINEINDAFGKTFFDPNIINSAAIRGVASARATTANEFLREVAQKFGTVTEKAPTGYVESTVKELEGLAFHPAIAEQLNKFKKGFIGDEATNNMLKAFDKAQNLWKASVTSLFPAFHGRNAISNVFLNFLDLGSAAFNPAKGIMASELLMKNTEAQKLEKLALGVGEKAISAKADLEKLLDKPILTDDFGKVWKFGEIQKEIKNRRIAFGDEFTGFLDIRNEIADKLKPMSEKSTIGRVGAAVNPLSQQNVAFKTGRAIGQKIEEQARILNFITNVQKTGDVVTAAERTKQFLFDYTNLSDFEKNVMRRLVPFYTFTRKNLELQATQLLKQPGKFATQAKLFSSIGEFLSGATLTSDEQKNLPEFLQEGLGIPVSKQGAQVQILNSIGLPIEQVFSAIKPNAILGSLSPIISVPLQVAIGKHFFFDKDLKDVDNAIAFKDAPQFIKDYIGFTVRKNKDGSNRYVALDPTRMFILSNIPPSSRVIGTIGQLEDENVSGKLKLLRQLTGLKPYGANLDTQAAANEKAKVRDLQDLLDASGVSPIFSRSFIPKK